SPLARRPGAVCQGDGLDIGALRRPGAARQGHAGRRRDPEVPVVAGRGVAGSRRICGTLEAAVGTRQEPAELTPPPARYSSRLRPAAGREPTVEWAVGAPAALLLAWLVLYPMAILLIGSFRTDLPMRAGHFTLANFAALVGDPANVGAIVNTIVSS